MRPWPPSPPFLAWLAAGAVLVLCSPAPAEEAAVVGDGRSVSLEYTLKLDDGSTADSNVGGEALVYEHGKEQILPALEKQLAGLEVGDTKKVDLSAEEGYGQKRDDLIRDVPLEQIPEEGRFAGARLVSQGPSGQPILAHVVSLTETTAKVDLNHPLAGEALHFEVKILAIE